MQSSILYTFYDTQIKVHIHHPLHGLFLLQKYLSQRAIRELKMTKCPEPQPNTTSVLRVSYYVRT